MRDFLNQPQFFVQVLEKINMSILIRSTHDQLQLLGEAPGWMEILGDCRSKQGFVTLGQPENFLEHFIDKANKFWDSEEGGSLYSGIWTQADVNYTDQVFEAIATFLNNHPVLLVQKINQSYSDIRKIIQSVRENTVHTEKMTQMAYFDDLTGLNNRRGFMNLAKQQLELAYQCGQTVAMYCIDIDFLKKINDEHGHVVGDLAIQNSALLLKKSFRQNDCIGRMGGDEFLVLATNLGESDAQNLVMRFKQNLFLWNNNAEQQLQLSLSIGYVFSKSGSIAFENLYHRADINMYKRKRNRKCAANAC